MKPEELRIGNWVLYDETVYTYGISKEESMVSASMILSMDENSDYADMINPIPLTEEWLLKFGFEVHPNSFSYSIFHLTEWDDYPLNWCIAMNKNNAIIVHKLKHVHQLQNLHHALTGEELTLKDA